MADNVTVVPWGLHPIYPWVSDELKRRAKEYGENPTPNGSEIYSGPRTAWIRFFSNGISKHPDAINGDGKPKFEGFVLGGVNGFNDSYGFDTDGRAVIGIDAYGKKHTVSIDSSTSVDLSGNSKTKTDFPHKPPPSITSISCELNGSSSGFPNTCRKITINWKCYSLSQLNYMIPYFLSPKITCLVEWGWNNYDNVSLVDLTDLDWLNNMFVDPKYTLDWIKASKGNYDAGIGFITDYGYKMTEDGGYECFTSITNSNRLMEGEQMHTQEVTIKRGDNRIPQKTFKEFVKKNLESIDSDKKDYVDLRKKMKLGEILVDEMGNEESIRDNIKERVFRISKEKSKSSKNKTERMYIRMDLVQDIINAFFKVEMERLDSNETAYIRDFDIYDTVVAANPFIKSANENVLVPNQFASRFAFDEPGKESAASKESFPEYSQYNLLFKDKVERIRQEYPQMKAKFDNLKDLINKSADSFPVYRDVSVYDDGGNLVQTYDSGYWGYLSDLFIDVKFFAKIVENNDSVLKMIEQLLQGINDALCQICQLKLVSSQYGNSKYSVVDENISGISSKGEASKLTRITLGSISSAFIKSMQLDVKISSEMMSQLVMQSANPEAEKDGSTRTKNVAANPIVSRYQAGDRLYDKGILKTTTDSETAPGAAVSDKEKLQAAKDAEKAAQAAKAENEAQLKKKQKARAETNEDTFLIYYEGADKKYFIAEKNKEFLSYVLTLPSIKSTYLNNAIMPGTKLTLELMGIAGIDYLAQFTIDHAPETYSYENVVWQVEDIRQEVSDNVWTTTITAGVRPLTTLGSENK